MSHEASKQFIEDLEDAGYEPKSYSGRGMFGKICVSVHDASAWEVARTLESDMDVPEPREDALGLGNILYWPQYPWPDGE